MAILPVLNQSYNDPPEITRAITYQGMNPDVEKLKKRKFFAGETEESSLPAAKHKCYKAAINSEDNSLFTNSNDEENASCDMDEMDTQVDSGQDSNSFPGDSQSSPRVKFHKSSRKRDAYDDIGASTSCSTSIKGKSQNGSFYSESGFEEDMGLTRGEKSPRLDVGWDDDDFLGDCITAEHCSENDQQKAEGLEEFLSSSGMNPNLYMLSAERWSLDQEAQLGRQKATIDQEFEQYFSTLML